MTSSPCQRNGEEEKSLRRERENPCLAIGKQGRLCSPRRGKKLKETRREQPNLVDEAKKERSAWMLHGRRKEAMRSPCHKRDCLAQLKGRRKRNHGASCLSEHARDEGLR